MVKWVKLAAVRLVILFILRVELKLNSKLEINQDDTVKCMGTIQPTAITVALKALPIEKWSGMCFEVRIDTPFQEREVRH